VATRVYIEGTIFAEEDAKVSVFDRGFLYGDSIYEVTRTFGGVPFALEEHLERLTRSARGIGLTLPPLDVIRDAVRTTVAAGANPESYIRIVVTRGAGDVGLDPALADHTRLIVIVRQVHGPDARMYTEGVEVAIVSVRRNLRTAIDPNVKSGNYLNNVLAVGEAKRKGAYESLMCDAEGRLAEGSSSNIFAVRKGEVQTPPLEVGILDGITRRKVLDQCGQHGIPAREVVLMPQDLAAADEAFLTSSIRGVLPIVRVDKKPVGSGAPGPVTRRVLELYQKLTTGK
jgi:branched-chain amino acid aminotransferase